MNWSGEWYRLWFGLDCVLDCVGLLLRHVWTRGEAGGAVGVHSFCLHAFGRVLFFGFCVLDLFSSYFLLVKVCVFRCILVCP